MNSEKALANGQEYTITTQVVPTKVGKTLVKSYTVTVSDATGRELWSQTTQSEGWLAVHRANALSFIEAEASR